MTENNLVIMTKYEGKDSINPAEQITLCKTHYNERKTGQDNYQVNEVNSSMPNVWCEACNPMN
jgi:hypothetical protein